jgi:hypothetical protein
MYEYVGIVQAGVCALAAGMMDMNAERVNSKIKAVVVICLSFWIFISDFSKSSFSVS